MIVYTRGRETTQTFVVGFELTVIADSPAEASQRALASLRDPGEGPWTADVRGGARSMFVAVGRPTETRSCETTERKSE